MGAKEAQEIQVERHIRRCRRQEEKEERKERQVGEESRREGRKEEKRQEGKVCEGSRGKEIQERKETEIDEKAKIGKETEIDEETKIRKIGGWQEIEEGQEGQVFGRGLWPTRIQEFQVWFGRIRATQERNNLSVDGFLLSSLQPFNESFRWLQSQLH